MSAGETRLGVAYALGGFLIWGFLPLYFRAVAHVPPDELLAHRVVWSLIVLLGAVALRRTFGALRALLRDPKQMAVLLLTAALLSANWFAFIWGIANERVLEISLGYYINPLWNAALGMLILGERQRPAQAAAIGLAAAGVGIQVWTLGTLPWLSLILAGTFGLYGLIRKMSGTRPVTGLTVETVFMLPVALGYLAWLSQREVNVVGLANVWEWPLIGLAGLLTVLPLIGFIAGAARLRYTTMGLLQYLTPTLHFTIAVFAFGEALTGAHLATFACIWVALAVYTLDARRAAKANA